MGIALEDVVHDHFETVIAEIREQRTTHPAGSAGDPIETGTLPG
ncbi:MAG: hypothetical protein R6U30_13705 [Halomonas sp.]